MALIITLILLGLALLLLEFLVIPGFGVTGILGFAALLGGVILAYVNYNVMTGHIVLGGTLAVSALFVWLTLRAKTWKKFTLHENITAQAIDSAEERGLSVGLEGTTLTRLAPMGTAVFNGIETEVATLDGIINAQQTIVIIKIEGAKVIVKSK